jgi:NAD dependent epimerase/dehydratase
MISNKRVLVTGAGGFIGSHLVEALVDIGCKVRAFVHYNSFNRWGWLDYIDQNVRDSVEIFAGDVQDPNGVRKSMKNIDVVFHLAALIGIPYSYYSPDSYIDTNVKGTLNVLQAARSSKTEKVIHTSTSEVYGTAQYVPIDEKHPLQGQSPYTASKIGADKVAESFFRAFDTPVTIVRPFNTYGPRQSARAVIPTIIIQLLSGAKEIQVGSLSPTRDFNYVKDVCQGFIAIANSKNTVGEVVNIAGSREVSIEQLADMIIKKINPKAKLTLDDQRVRPEKSEVMRLLGDNKKITALTGWEPKYSLDKGIDETIKWFKNDDNLRLYKSSIYNV